MALRFRVPSFLARAMPPIRPSVTAALFLPSSFNVSSSSPVAILMTVTALEMTSAGRLWPLGVFGIATCFIVMAWAVRGEFVRRQLPRIEHSARLLRSPDISTVRAVDVFWTSERPAATDLPIHERLFALAAGHGGHILTA